MTARGRRTQRRADERRARREQRTGPAAMPVPEQIRALADHPVAFCRDCAMGYSCVTHDPQPPATGPDPSAGGAR